MPADGAEDVPLDRPIAIRFSEAIAAASLTEERLTLSGPDGPLPVRVIVAEDGRLAFVWPAEPLAEGTT